MSFPRPFVRCQLFPGFQFSLSTRLRSLDGAICRTVSRPCLSSCTVVFFWGSPVLTNFYVHLYLHKRFCQGSLWRTRTRTPRAPKPRNSTGEAILSEHNRNSIHGRQRKINLVTPQLKLHKYIRYARLAGTLWTLMGKMPPPVYSCPDQISEGEWDTGNLSYRYAPMAVYIKLHHTGWAKNVSHFHESSLNRIKNRH